MGRREDMIYCVKWATWGGKTREVPTLTLSLSLKRERGLLSCGAIVHSVLDVDRLVSKILRSTSG